jgi:transcriptional regulator with XRE-family HTH domain
VNRSKLTDYGRTVALGDYEAPADAILYELDPAYRRQLKKQRRQSERTFGASLMRLRKQRRLKRSDFAPISSKEIARIERSEVEKPHAKTLGAIAGRLGVRPEEIEDN